MENHCNTGHPHISFGDPHSSGDYFHSECPLCVAYSQRQRLENKIEDLEKDINDIQEKLAQSPFPDLEILEDRIDKVEQSFDKAVQWAEDNNLPGATILGLAKTWSD